jgi:hypothetical protein
MNTFKLRPAVFEYLTQADIEIGVDALLEWPNKLPADLQESELTLYFEAWMGAHQVQAAYALDLADLWTQVWGNALRTKLLPPGAARRKLDGDLNPKSLWQSGDFVRINDADEYFWVTLNVQGASCGCSLNDEKYPEGLSLVDGYMNSAYVSVISGGEIDLGPLTEISRALSGR